MINLLQNLLSHCGKKLLETITLNILRNLQILVWCRVIDGLIKRMYCIYSLTQVSTDLATSYYE